MSGAATPGGGATLAAILAAGGATLDGVTLAPVTLARGYAVGLVDGTAITLDVATVTEAALTAALESIAAVHRAPYVGAWVDGGRLHLDPVAVVARRRAALALGRATRQLAVYDLARGESVEVTR